MTEYDARTLKLVETLVATFLLDPAHERRPEALTELVETVLNRELEKCRRKKIEKFEKVVDSLVRVFLSTNEWPPETNTDAIGRQVEKFVREEFFKLMHAKTPLERDVLKVYRNSELFSRSKTEELQEYMRFVTERVQTSLNQAATQARASRDRSNALKRESRARMKLLKEAHGGHHAPLEEAEPLLAKQQPVGPGLQSVMDIPNPRNRILDELTTEQSRRLGGTDQKMKGVMSSQRYQIKHDD